MVLQLYHPNLMKLNREFNIVLYVEAIFDYCKFWNLLPPSELIVSFLVVSEDGNIPSFVLVYISRVIDVTILFTYLFFFLHW